MDITKINSDWILLETRWKKSKSCNLFLQAQELARCARGRKSVSEPANNFSITRL